jgi:hypothetical protein
MRCVSSFCQPHTIEYLYLLMLQKRYGFVVSPIVLVCISQNASFLAAVIATVPPYSREVDNNNATEENVQCALNELHLEEQLDKAEACCQMSALLSFKRL